MGPGCQLWEVEGGENISWFNCLSLQYADYFSSNSLFSMIMSLSSLSPAHHSWRCTTSSKAHYYCLKFGAGVDRSHHVWRMPKVEVGKVKWCSTETSPNYCDGVQWAKHFLLSRLAFRSCLHNYEWCAWALERKKEKSIESGTFWLVGWSYQWATDPRQRSRNRSSNNSQAFSLTVGYTA